MFDFGEQEKPRQCLACGAILERKRQKNGRLESPRAFRNRKFCDHHCATVYDNPMKRNKVVSLQKQVEMNCPWEAGRQSNDILMNPFL